MSQTNIMNKIQYFVIIAKKKKKNKFLSLLSDYGAHAIEIVYAHGSVTPSSFAAVFGFEAVQGKVVISCLLKTEKAKELIEVLNDEYKFDKPNTGIAYSIPVEGLAF